nr:LCP family protein [Candidatus Dormibacteraeota bacterium]
MSAHDQGGSQTGARTRVLHQDRRLTRRSVAHTIAAIIPGAGLLGTRYRRLGAILLGILAAVLVIGALVVLAKGALTTALNIAVNPTSLMVLVVLTIVVAVVWILSIVLTHAGTAPPRTDRSTRRGLRILTAVMCLLVALPAFQVVRYALIQRDVVGTVFSGPSLGGLKPSDGAAAPDPSSSDPWNGVDRVNLLLVGSDAGNDRVGVRTDSMVVASIDPQTGHATLISLPRNLERAPIPASDPLHTFFPNGFYCPTRGTGHDCLLNAIWAEAVSHTDLYPGDNNPGLTALRRVIGETIGLNIDYSTVIDLDGFEALVNAMGGVKVNVTQRLPINGYHPGDNPN